MALDIDHYKQMFSDTVQQLAGSPIRSYLEPTVNAERKSGEIAYVDGVGPLSGLATRVADGTSPESFKTLSNVRTKRIHEDDIATTPANDTFANYKKMDTPHVEIDRIRTLVAPKICEFGHVISKWDKILEFVDPQNKILKQGMRSFFLSKDYLIIAALKASTVTRGKLEGATSAVSFPAGQQVTLAFATYAGKLNVDGIGVIAAKFDSQYVQGERKFLIISPTQKFNLIAQSGGKLHSTDFVSSYEFFSKGELPEVYGFTIITHPLLADTEAYAYTENGLTWAKFQDLETDLGVLPGRRFAVQAYLSELGDCKRTDDYRVVQVTIPAS